MQQIPRPPVRRVVWVLSVMGLTGGCSDYDLAPTATASGLATQLAAEPPLLDLGAVPLDRAEVATVRLVNQGDDPISLSHLDLVGSSAFQLDLPDSGQVGPGQGVDVAVAFAPGAFEDSAVLEVWYTSADDDRALLSVPVMGTGLAGAVTLEPAHVDLGGAPDDCVLEHPVTVTNVGTAPVELQDLAVVGEGFSLETPVGAAALAPGASAELVVSYTATETAGEAGTVWVHHDGVAGVASASVAVERLPRSYTEESFLQDGPWEAVDILFAIDGSGSMDDDTARLADNASTFFEALEALGVDAQVAGVTRDDGCTNGGAVASSDPGAEAVFARSLDGQWGAHTESLLTVATHALEAADRCNEGVFRADARTAVVVLSDEPDQSDDPWQDYVARMRAVDPHVVVSAIVGPAPDGCETAYPGLGYHDAAAATGGATVSLCAADWGPFLSLQAELVRGNPRTAFPLSEPAGPGVAFVAIDGEPVESGWALDRVAQALVFEPHAMPGPGASITVEYPRAAVCDPAPGDGA